MRRPDLGFITVRRHGAVMQPDPAVSIAADPDVYPPSEDSLLLIRSFDVEPGEKVLEIGCGSGIVAIHCALAGAEVSCCDINPAAVALTLRNADDNGAELDACVCDLFPAGGGRYDTIVFNLPYLPVEDEGMLARAWSGGDGGLGPLPRLIAGAPDRLVAGGRLIVVVSSLMDGERTGRLLDGLNVRVLAELPLFFERLRVLELRFSR